MRLWGEGMEKRQTDADTVRRVGRGKGWMATERKGANTDVGKTQRKIRTVRIIVPSS